MIIKTQLIFYTKKTTWKIPDADSLNLVIIFACRNFKWMPKLDIFKKFFVLSVLATQKKPLHKKRLYIKILYAIF
jgi:hypothetical protein